MDDSVLLVERMDSGSVALRSVKKCLMFGAFQTPHLMRRTENGTEIQGHLGQHVLFSRLDLAV